MKRAKPDKSIDLNFSWNKSEFTLFNDQSSLYWAQLSSKNVLFEFCVIGSILVFEVKYVNFGDKERPKSFMALFELIM